MPAATGPAMWAMSVIIGADAIGGRAPARVELGGTRHDDHLRLMLVGEASSARRNRALVFPHAVGDDVEEPPGEIQRGRA
jgi:hypothetical protein